MDTHRKNVMHVNMRGMSRHANLMLPLQPLVFVEASYVMASLKARRMNIGTQCSLSIRALMSLEAEAIASLYVESTLGKDAILWYCLRKMCMLLTFPKSQGGAWSPGEPHLTDLV